MDRVTLLRLEEVTIMLAAARSMARPMARNDVAVKLDAQVAKEAKMVAAARNITLAEYISEVLRPIVHADLRAETSQMLGEKEPRGPRQSKPPL
jgi:hypothetical protein